MPAKGLSNKNMWRMKVEVDAMMNLEIRVSSLAKLEIDRGDYDVDELLLECSQQPGWFRVVGFDRITLMNDFLDRAYVVPYKSVQSLCDSKDKNSMIFPGHAITEIERERMNAKA